MSLDLLEEKIRKAKEIQKIREFRSSIHGVSEGDHETVERLISIKKNERYKGKKEATVANLLLAEGYAKRKNFFNAYYCLKSALENITYGIRNQVEYDEEVVKGILHVKKSSITYGNKAVDYNVSIASDFVELAKKAHDTLEEYLKKFNNKKSRINKVR